MSRNIIKGIHTFSMKALLTMSFIFILQNSQGQTFVNSFRGIEVSFELYPGSENNRCKYRYIFKNISQDKLQIVYATGAFTSKVLLPLEKTSLNSTFSVDCSKPTISMPDFRVNNISQYDRNQAENKEEKNKKIQLEQQLADERRKEKQDYLKQKDSQAFEKKMKEEERKSQIDKEKRDDARAYSAVQKEEKLKLETAQRILKEEQKALYEKSLMTFRVKSDVGIDLYLNDEKVATIEEEPYIFSKKAPAGDVHITVKLLATGETYLDDIIKDLQPLTTKYIDVKALSKINNKEEIRLKEYAIHQRNLRQMEEQARLARERERLAEEERERVERVKFSLVKKYLYRESLDYINSTNKGGVTPLAAAIKDINIAAVKALVSFGADINKKNNTLKDEEVKIDYFSNGTLLSEKDPVEVSLQVGDLNTVKFLLDSTDNTYNGKITCDQLFGIKKFSMFNYLVERMKVDYKCEYPNETGYTLLHHACRLGDKDWCRYLINNGLNINQRGIVGYELFFSISEAREPIYLATVNCHYEVCKLLLESGAKASKHGRASNGPLNIKINTKLSKLAELNECSNDIIELFKKYDK